MFEIEHLASLGREKKTSIEERLERRSSIMSSVETLVLVTAGRAIHLQSRFKWAQMLHGKHPLHCLILRKYVRSTWRPLGRCPGMREKKVDKPPLPNDPDRREAEGKLPY